ncbi:alpha/beta hydrolase [Deinococcus maricopensis]|uniref:Haloacetate dehalogenase n=1 Tax=Deinococcus maricopensis (strain DSM 21211 / LMG 22137 / NRRL B-23946 / LB-34) TaxID=709986 RepID=E8U334_DEIML|nr:alpha/beta hydrolase [Deinococcus maricopensis]ADV65772.1 Haloacetate dehalogenase [Deinococcus maricopensis DSM 21211]
MFPGFTLRTVRTPEATLRVRTGGEGPPLLLLHGHPQTHVMWHLVAPRLARHFTVVCPDLRGYGDSVGPPSTPDHEPASKRAMARDMLHLMRQLGHDRFRVAGHDRGGRVAYRLALDHPASVERLAVLDIIPTGDAWRRADRAFALTNWHWAFLAQPHPLPERLISANPGAFYYREGRERFAPDALADYERCVHRPEVIHAMCEDYRAGATLDDAHDRADRGVRRLRCPVLALWSAREELERWYDVLAVWRAWADDVRGRALDAGHYLAEEAPEEVAAELHAFFSA